MAHYPSIQSLLRKYGVKPKKRLGQNYLAAQPTMRKIVDALGATSADIVLEIGCGLGLMTAMLAERCKRVIAIDADASSLEIARAEFGDRDNIEWVEADILDVDISAPAAAGMLKVIGNVPYNISSPILFHLLDHRAHIDRAVLMMQKEVVDRVVAKPGGKTYGALSVMLQSYAACRKLFNVARTNFMPPPDVTSSVVELKFPSFVRRGRARLAQQTRKLGGGSVDLYPSSPPLTKGRDFFERLQRIVQAAFQQRRKTLRNALLGSRDLAIAADDLDCILADTGIDGRRRPETLSVEEFHRLAGAMSITH